MTEVQYEEFRITFSRTRLIEEHCSVTISIPAYYSQDTREKVALDFATEMGLWKEYQELSKDHPAIVKSAIPPAAPVCSRCGLGHHVSDCDE